MPKYQPDAITDEKLGITAAATVLYICAGQPTTFAEASDTKMLGGVALTPGIGNGDFSAANGDTSGRKLTLAAQPGIEALVEGHADHYALAVAASSKLLMVGTLSEPHQTVYVGNLINFPETDVDEIRDLA